MTTPLDRVREYMRNVPGPNVMIGKDDLALLVALADAVTQYRESDDDEDTLWNGVRNAHRNLTREETP